MGRACSRDVRWPGSPLCFQPSFRRDTVTVFRLRSAASNDSVSLYLDIEEQPSEGPPLVWEAWTGEGWDEIDVTDETGKLSRPGMISFVPPPTSPRPSANINAAAGPVVTAGNPLDAALFKPGDSVIVTQSPNTELRLVAGVSGVSVTLNAPLEKTYTGGSISISALPRFGQSRDWVRARLKEDGSPAQPDIDGIYLNALWARQVETVTQEILGGGLGVPTSLSFSINRPCFQASKSSCASLTDFAPTWSTPSFATSSPPLATRLRIST